jgi:DNA primase
VIGEEEISQVRTATDLVALISTRVVLKQRRNEFWGCCPFHNEKTASFKVDPASQFYYCFGCGESGDAFTFTMKTENVDFPDAIRILARRANIELVEETSSPQRGRKARLYAVTQATVDFYHQQLMRVKGAKPDLARSYLSARGMGGEVAKQWKLGFAPGSGLLVKYLKGLGFSTQEMLDVNVAVSQRSGEEYLADRFYDRIVFPIFDIQGRAIAFGGRVFLPDDPSPAKYLNSAETRLFKKRDNLYAIDQAKAQIVIQESAIVVEGYTDTIALHQAGFTNTVATLGTALTTQHLKDLARFCNRVILLFDGDEAGQRAADRALDLIGSALAPTASDNRRADIYVALLPNALDPADYLVAAGSAALQLVIDNAVSLIRYSLNRILSGFVLAEPEQCSRAEAAALRILLPLKGTALVTNHLSYLADRLNYSEIAENEMRQRFEKLVAPRFTASTSQSDAPVNTQQPKTDINTRQAASERIISLERELLFLFIEHPELRSQLTTAFEKMIWIEQAHKSIASELIALDLAEASLAPQECLSLLTARLPEQAVTLSAAHLKEYSSIEPVKLADLLLFNIREAKLQAAINKINGERRLLNSDDPKNHELFRELAPLQQELAELRKKFRGSTN